MRKVVLKSIVFLSFGLSLACSQDNPLIVQTDQADNPTNENPIPNEETPDSSDTPSDDDNPTAPVSCPTNYVEIRANQSLGLSAFCISKYEMKVQENDGAPFFNGYNNNTPLDVSLYKPESRPDGIPWVRITLSDAIAECSSLGEKYHLASAREWQAVANEVESEGANWSSGHVGNGKLYSGHSDSGISASAIADGYAVTGTLSLSAGDGTDPYVGTGQDSTMAFGSGREQRRTFFLNSGEVIWDLAGNARELVDFDEQGGSLSYTGPGSSGSQELNSTQFSDMIATAVSSNAVALALSWFLPSNATWNHDDNGIGKAYVSSNAKTERIIGRGGNFSSGNNPGLYTVDFDQLFSATSSSGSFRCVFSLN